MHRFSNLLRGNRRQFLATAAVGTIGSGFFIYQLQPQLHPLNLSHKSECEMAMHKTRQFMPTYRRSEVQKHRTVRDRIWVTYEDGVYDITEFVKVHPGGSEKIMMAAGGSIEPFWSMYPFHKKQGVINLLIPYQIGQLHKDDILKAEQIADFSDMQKDDISRGGKLVVHQEFPFCAETEKGSLAREFFTPEKDLYVRNHNLVPEFDEDFESEFQLEIVNSSLKKQNQELNRSPFEITSFSLQELKRLRTQEVITQIACAGNRRSHTRKVYPTVKGVAWDLGAIGNNKYKGVLIRDILLASGFSETDLSQMGHLHLIATGMDKDFQGEPFKVSIPLERALDPDNKVILAYEMDGKPLSKDHGYPLRLVAPGYIGVRNCKWVCNLELSLEEANSNVQKRDYKWVAEPDWTKIDLEKYPAINGNLSNSCICEPADGQTVAPVDGKVTLRGWATGDGTKGTQAVGVQISLDEGKTWQDAEITNIEKTKDKKVFSWTLWKFEADVNKKQKSLNPMVRTVNSDGAIQDGKWKDMFNVRGLLNTTPHKIEIHIQHQEPHGQN